MRYCRFQVGEEVKYGMVDVNKVIELVGPYYQETSAPTENIYELEDVTLLSPVTPKQVVAIGLNYVDHAKEQGKAIPDEPMMFMVSPHAVIGPDDTIHLAREEHRIEYEAELAIVVGKKAYQVSEDEASDYIFGYTIANDVSDRHLQKQDGQFTRAKSFSTYKPMGPFVATDLKYDRLKVQLKQNGTLKQDGNTRDFIHSVESVFAAVTDVMTLEPGDVIITGTPAGVGPLEHGDHLQISIEGIGTLDNQVE